MRRPTADQLAASAQLSCTDVEFVRKYPTLAEYLTSVRWDDGKPREPSGLAIDMSGGTVRVSVHDRALRQTLYTDAPSLDEALDLVEGVLRAGNAPWRRWRADNGKQR